MRLRRIVILIKQVPETSGVRMDEETGVMVREGVSAIINPLDLYAIECALELAADIPGTETVVLSMGPPAAEQALREALSMGIDHGMLLSGRAFAGADTLATSTALAAAISAHGPFDLILCGERATDGDTGQVGPEVAALLNLPVATYVEEIEKVTPGQMIVRRLLEAGSERLEIDLPALLTVVKKIASPRLPTLRGKQRARQSELPVLGPDDLGLEPSRLGLRGSPTRVVRIHRPKVSRACERLEARDPRSVDIACNRIIDFLKERDLI
jgi:electron transfer flavoprotein beta subunit